MMMMVYCCLSKRTPLLSHAQVGWGMRRANDLMAAYERLGGRSRGRWSRPAAA
jgi:hypothetical protein